MIQNLRERLKLIRVMLDERDVLSCAFPDTTFVCAEGNVGLVGATAYGTAGAKAGFSGGCRHYLSVSMCLSVVCTVV